MNLILKKNNWSPWKGASKSSNCRNKEKNQAFIMPAFPLRKCHRIIDEGTFLNTCSNKYRNDKIGYHSFANS